MKKKGRPQNSTNARATCKVRYRKMKDGRYSIYLDIYENYKRRTQTLNLIVSKDYSKGKNALTKDQAAVDLAHKAAMQYATELSSKRVGIESVFEHRDRFDFIEFWENLIKAKPRKAFELLLGKFKNYLKAQHKKTILFRDCTYQLFFDFFFNSKEFDRCENNTVRWYIATMNTIVHEAKKQKFIKENPISELRKPKATVVEINYLSEAEIKQLLNAPYHFDNQHVKYAFIFCLCTGIRWSDVSQLTWANIQLSEAKMRLKMQKTKDFLEIGLGDDAINIVQSLEKGMPTERVFFNLPSLVRANRMLNDWTKRAGIEKHISWHCSRHSFACLLLAKGADLYTVSKLLGHTNIATTQKYAKVVSEVKQKAIASLPKFLDFDLREKREKE